MLHTWSHVGFVALNILKEILLDQWPDSWQEANTELFISICSSVYNISRTVYRTEYKNVYWLWGLDHFTFLISVRLSVCHKHCFFFFVSRWNQAIFWPSVLRDKNCKTLFFNFWFRPLNAQNLIPKIFICGSLSLS